MMSACSVLRRITVHIRRRKQFVTLFAFPNEKGETRQHHATEFLPFEGEWVREVTYSLTLARGSRQAVASD